MTHFHPDELSAALHRAKQVVAARQRIRDSQWCCLFSFLLAVFLPHGAVRIILAAGFLLLHRLLREMSAVLVIGRAELNWGRDKHKTIPLPTLRPGANRSCRRRWRNFNAVLLAMLSAIVLGYGRGVAAAITQSAPLMAAGIAALLLCAGVLIFLASRWPIDRLFLQTDLLDFPFHGAIISFTTLWLILHIYVSLSQHLCLRIL